MCSPDITKTSVYAGFLDNSSLEGSLAKIHSILTLIRSIQITGVAESRS